MIQIRMIASYYTTIRACLCVWCLCMFIFCTLHASVNLLIMTDLSAVGGILLLFTPIPTILSGILEIPLSLTISLVCIVHVRVDLGHTL